jgi:hypothetical protein
MPSALTDVELGDGTTTSGSRDVKSEVEAGRAGVRRWRLLLLGVLAVLAVVVLVTGAVVVARRASASNSETAGSGSPGGADHAVAAGEDAEEEVPPAQERGITVKDGGDDKVGLYHRVAVDLEGPVGDVATGVNVFADCLMECVWVHGEANETVVVQGFFAADGDAAETGATEGNVWRCLFSPWRNGEWTWSVRFRSGTDVAVGAAGGRAVAPDGAKGKVTVKGRSRSKVDVKAKGRLRYVGKRYMQFEGSGQFFVSGGPDTPEGLLNYRDIANTGNSQTRSWEPHVRDWRAGDPTWQGGKGKGLIGMVNYLSSLGLNSCSFMLFSYLGSDGGVYPTVGDPATEKERFDVAKLAQWDVVFEHMQRTGLMMHIKLMEVQSIKYHDDGTLGRERRLYYREMVARFGHHNAVVWNLGEEIANARLPKEQYFIDAPQIREFGNHLSSLDVMGHPIVQHTWPTNEVKEPFNRAVIADGSKTAINGFSLQGEAHIIRYYEDVKRWVDESEAAGRPKVVTSDEQGPYESGIASDARDKTHFANRTGVLWPAILAGGAGHQTYFGFSFANSDIDVEDMRSYDGWFHNVAAMLAFLRDNAVPVQDMRASEELTSNGMYAFYKPGAMYVVQVVARYATVLDLRDDPSDSGYSVRWFDPAAGGALQRGSVACAPAGAWAALGAPPGGKWAGRDWIALLKSDAACGKADKVACGGAFLRVDDASNDGALQADVEFSLVDKAGQPLAGAVTFTGETGQCDCTVGGGATVVRTADREVTLTTTSGNMTMSCTKPWEPSGRQCVPSLLELDGDSC